MTVNRNQRYSISIKESFYLMSQIHKMHVYCLHSWNLFATISTRYVYKSVNYEKYLYLCILNKFLTLKSGIFFNHLYIKKSIVQLYLSHLHRLKFIHSILEQLLKMKILFFFFVSDSRHIFFTKSCIYTFNTNAF